MQLARPIDAEATTHTGLVEWVDVWGARGRWVSGPQSLDAKDPPWRGLVVNETQPFRRRWPRTWGHLREWAPRMRRRANSRECRNVNVKMIMWQSLFVFFVRIHFDLLIYSSLSLYFLFCNSIERFVMGNKSRKICLPSSRLGSG